MITQDVYRMIRELIVKGDYLGGEAMPEQELAERLQVSRTPVREALRRLQAEGVVERRANRRVHLVGVDPQAILDIFRVRAGIEPMAARLAAARVDEAFLDLLARQIERMDAARLAPEPNLKLYRQANEDFHWAILRQSGNHALDFTVRAAARWPVAGPTFSGWSAFELARSQDHHREALAAFEAGDGDWAEAVMSLHLHAAHAAYRRIAEAVAEDDEYAPQRDENERDTG